MNFKKKNPGHYICEYGKNETDDTWFKLDVYQNNLKTYVVSLRLRTRYASQLIYKRENNTFNQETFESEDLGKWYNYMVKFALLYDKMNTI